MPSNGKRGAPRKVLQPGSWRVLDHRPRNSHFSCSNWCRPDIRSILLNQRKLELIEEMRRNVYEQAVKNQDVETFAP
jgi:hypothetical protein